jgi:formate hydrogenlyase transcriptional activator
VSAHGANRASAHEAMIPEAASPRQTFEEHAPFEALLVELSTRFINLDPKDVDREIEDALRRVCGWLGIDYAVLWQWTAAVPDLILPTHAYPPLADPGTPDPLRQTSFPWVEQQMQAGRMVVVSRLDDMPEEAAVDRQSARESGILSNLTIPLSVGGAPAVGALAFSTLRAPREWTDADVNRLQLVAQVFATALARKRDEEARGIGEARLEAGADLAGLAFYELDYANGTSYIDDRFRALFGIPPDRESGLQPFEFWVEHLHPDDRDGIMDARRQMHEGVVERLMLEYRYQHPTRGEIWLHHVARSAARDASGRTIRTTGVFRDITERKRAEEDLRRSLAEVERLKDRLQAESEYLKAEIGVGDTETGITGSSPAIKQVLQLIGQVAPTRSSVLVLGETGTGKELLARAIHTNSPRRGRVMIKVNCAAMPSGLVESELFGREKGAFTGALSRQVGRFELADGSTIFLDEVGELSLEVQAKLLRVLEDGEFERLGSPRTIKVDVRLIAATNRDLAEEVRRGRFREDLYYRLNVFPIRMPALRERAEDIPQLVWTFLEEFSSRMGKKIGRVPRTTMEALTRYEWPGNVRELRNVIEHGAIVTTGDALKVRLPDGREPVERATTLADVEREHILRTLERTHGRVKGPNGAAAALGLNASTLRSRMKKLGIPYRSQTKTGSA